MTDKPDHDRLAAQAESFAKYHEEHARYGGASQEFHTRAGSFLRGIEANHERIAALEAERDEAREEAADWRGIVFDLEQNQRASVLLTQEERRLPWEPALEDESP